MEHPIPFGPYVLLERINVGGMAEVFRARERGREGFERTVAIKKILPHVAADPELVELFRQEARLAASLTHVNIVQVYGSGREAGSAYIAMEYVRGRDLRAVFNKCQRGDTTLPVALACHIVLKAAAALHYAHQKYDRVTGPLRIVHRDVSPGNILVSFDGDVKLIDFGVATIAGVQRTPQGELLRGKLGYASPEQLERGAVDARSDVFALGVVLHELLTQRRLFGGAESGERSEDAEARRRQTTIVPPSAVRPEIPAELDAIVLRALASAPADRFPSAGVLHESLQNFMYDAGLFEGRHELATWMHRTFAAVIDRERRRERSVGGPPPPPLKTSPGAEQIRDRLRRPSIDLGLAGAGPKRRQTLVLTSNRRSLPSKPARGARASRAETPSSGPKVSLGAPAATEIEWDETELETQAYTIGAFARATGPEARTWPRGLQALEGKQADAPRGAGPTGTDRRGAEAQSPTADGARSVTEGRGAAVREEGSDGSRIGGTGPAEASQATAARGGRGENPRAGAQASQAARAGVATVRPDAAERSATHLRGAEERSRAAISGVVETFPSADRSDVEADPPRDLLNVPPGRSGSWPSSVVVAEVSRSPLETPWQPEAETPKRAANEGGGDRRRRGVGILEAETPKRAANEGGAPADVPAAEDKVEPRTEAPSPSAQVVGLAPRPEASSDEVDHPRGARVWPWAAALLLAALGGAAWVERARWMPTSQGSDVQVSSVASAAAAAPQAASPPSHVAPRPAAAPEAAEEEPSPDEAPAEVAGEEPDPGPADAQPAVEPAEATPPAKPAASRRRATTADPRMVRTAERPGVDKTATLRIGTVAGVAPADVHVDGEYVGKTPRAAVSVTPGRHTVQYTWPDGREVRKTVEVADGAVKVVKAG